MASLTPPFSRRRSLARISTIDHNFGEGGSMALRLIAASKTDVGKQREQNEDACYYQIVEDDRHASGLFIVADGMGGYHAGEVASRIAVETIRDSMQSMLGPTSSRPTVPLNRDLRKRGKRKS